MHDSGPNAPTPPRDLDGCENKGVEGKGICIFVITKGDPLGFATNAERAFGVYTPVVTGSMRNRVNPQRIEAPGGAYDGVSDELASG